MPEDRSREICWMFCWQTENNHGTQCKDITLKTSRSSGPVFDDVEGPVIGCLTVGTVSIVLIDTLAESTTPPVEGIVIILLKCQILLFCFSFLRCLVYGETEDQFDLREEKKE
jgi:hypothetical protein